jgi:hypothetical protein
MKYEVVRNTPVARFWYKGNHSHPVRRTVLVIEQTKNYIRGYELREGNHVRIASRAPVKTYRRDSIAKGQSLRLENPIRKSAPQQTTLVRKPLMDLIEVGV